jgi:hypothetical protein
MRIFAADGFQFRVTALPAVMGSARLPQFCFESRELGLETVKLLGLALDGALLSVRFRWTGECQSANDLLKEADHSRQARQVPLVDLVGGRHQHCSSRSIRRRDG